MDSAPKFYLLTPDGQRVSIRHLGFKVTSRDAFYEFDFHKYLDIGRSSPISDTAVAEIKDSSLPGTLVLMREKGREPRVAFISKDRPVTTTVVSTEIKDDIIGLNVIITTPILGTSSGNDGGRRPFAVKSTIPEPLDPSVEARSLNRRGADEVKRGNYDRAIEYFDQAIKLDPNLADAFCNRGGAYSDRGDDDRAIASLDQAIKLRPAFPDAFFNRGNVHHRKGDYDLAIEDFDQAIKLNPAYGQAFNNRAGAYTYKGDYDSAIKDYGRLINLESANSEWFYNRGVVRLYQGQQDKAIKDFDRAIKLNPNHAKAFSNRGVAYTGKRQYDRAIADFDRAIKISPTFADAFRNRAFAKWSKGDSDGSAADTAIAERLNKGGPS